MFGARLLKQPSGRTRGPETMESAVCENRHDFAGNPLFYKGLRGLGGKKHRLPFVRQNAPKCTNNAP